MDKTELERLQRYMRTLFGNPQIKVLGLGGKKDSAALFIGDEPVGTIIRDDEDEDLSYNFGMGIKRPAGVSGKSPLDKAEFERLQSHMRELFGNPQIKVVGMMKKKDSAELHIGEEFVGIITRDDGDKLSDNFDMAILDTDLED